FYLCASRPEDLLALSYRTSDEEGNPAVRSFYVDDVRDLFTAELDDRRRVRELSQVTWRPEQAPTARERERALAAVGPRRDEQTIGSLSAPAVLEELAAREAWSAGQIEAYASCPVKWLVEKSLQPRSLEPDSEPMARGNVAHAVLEATLRGLRDRTGSARLRPQSLPLARELLLHELGSREPELPLSTVPARRRSGFRRLQADLLRYLRTTAERSSELEPAHFELSFGGRDDDHGAVEVADGLRLRGRIDRIDRAPDGAAVVIDYKGSKGYSFTKWEDGRRLQVALYMLAVRDLLGTEPVAGLYQPLGGDQKARGIVLRDSPLADAAVSTDVAGAEDMNEALERMRELAAEAAAALREGRLEPHPGQCHWREGGGCSYPTICRCDGA
ncbi:MAG TPA: PD-(D/E)XK nuclease family protein, partial [Solirubrobacteraceae bacterium]